LHCYARTLIRHDFSSNHCLITNMQLEMHQHTFQRSHCSRKRWCEPPTIFVSAIASHSRPITPS